MKRGRDWGWGTLLRSRLFVMNLVWAGGVQSNVICRGSTSWRGALVLGKAKAKMILPATTAKIQSRQCLSVGWRQSQELALRPVMNYKWTNRNRYHGSCASSA